MSKISELGTRMIHRVSCALVLAPNVSHRARNRSFACILTESHFVSSREFPEVQVGQSELVCFSCIPQGISSQSDKRMMLKIVVLSTLQTDSLDEPHILAIHAWSIITHVTDSK